MKCDNPECGNEIDSEFREHFLDDCEVCEECWENGISINDEPTYNEALISILLGKER